MIRWSNRLFYLLSFDGCKMGSYHLHVSAFLVEDTIGRAFVWGFDVQNKRKTRTSLSLKCSNTDAPKFGGHSLPGLCLLCLVGASSFTSACPFLTNWVDLFLLSYIFWRELLVMVYWRASSFFFRLFCLQMGFLHQQVDTLTWAPGGLCQFEKTGWAGLDCGVGFERVFWKVWWRSHCKLFKATLMGRIAKNADGHLEM